MKRYYLGIDWADQDHMVWASDQAGKPVLQRKVAQRVEEMREFGRWLYERQGEGIELWAAIEKPEGRIVDFLLDHGVAVYPVNPKALDRARDRFRMSQSKSDAFDAYVLAEFLRTDHGHLRALTPNSPKAQELKILTEDHYRLQRQQTRLQHQVAATLKEYYPRPLEVFGDLCTQTALDFLREYRTPEALKGLSRKRWERFAQAHALSDQQSQELWQGLHRPQLAVPEHVVRAKAELLEVLLEELRLVANAVERYQKRVERFFASMPAAKWAKTLPGGKSGVTLPTVWAQLGDAAGRWESFRHLQAWAGGVPATKSSGKSRTVQFRYACNKKMRYALYWLAFVSLRQSEWARAYYDSQRARGHSHPRALRALGAKWLKIIFVMWRDHKPYEENYHLANIARQRLHQAA